MVDLDDVATRDAVAADPATFVARPGVVCIDEYQHVPLVLDAIKVELNRDGRPGRFILTVAARHELLPVAAQALTGRLHRLLVYPLSQGEISGIEEDFLARVLEGDVHVGPVSMRSAVVNGFQRVPSGAGRSTPGVPRSGSPSGALLCRRAPWRGCRP